MGLGVSSSCSPSPPSPVLRVLQGDANIIAVDGRDGDREENATTDYTNDGSLLSWNRLIPMMFAHVNLHPHVSLLSPFLWRWYHYRRISLMRVQNISRW